MLQLDTPWLAIINPNAGTPISGNRMQSLKDRLRHELGAKIFVTETAMHAASLVESAKDGTTFVVFGGDGTIAEIVNQMNLNCHQLLPLGGGTGNGLARDLGITTIKNAFTAVRNNHKCPVDVLRVSFLSRGKSISRLAISTCALGYTAETVDMAKRLFRPLGSSRYLISLIVRALQAQPFEIIIHNGGEIIHEKTASTIIVNNTSHVGNFRLLNGASCHDSKMDVLLARDSISSQILLSLGIFAKNKTFSLNADFNSETLSLHVDLPLKLMVDGDIWNDVTDVHFEFLPNKLICFTGNE